MKSGLKLYTGNRMELLADAAAEILRVPLSSTFAQEMIVVPNRGMERWLSMQLAERLGVWANARFLLPNSFADELFKRVFSSFPDTLPLFDPALLTWKIMSLLSGAIVKEDVFSQVASYLTLCRGDKKSLLRRYQLSAKIADIFDQYTIYRPEMVLDWEKGRATHWQASLWREITREIKTPHRSRRWKDFFASIKSLDAGLLPERVVAFGLSSLPPYHTGLMAAIASRVPVYLFVLNPCAEFWDEILSERESGRILRKERSKKNAVSPPRTHGLHLEQGNPLLAALGGYGRDFLAQLHDIDAEETAIPVVPKDQGLLSLIQADILLLNDRSTADSRTPIEARDRSVQVHSCHSPLREVEVLYDSLLRLFETQKHLNPSDVLVMTPDIKAYAPFIRAVFESPEAPHLKIPYTITDLPLTSENRIAETFLSLLALPASRFGAGTIMSLLETAEVRAAFGIDETDLPLIFGWVRESGIRWGLDAAILADEELPWDSSDNTWEAGLDRLLLGYALPSGSGKMFKGIAGFDGIEGSNALLAGKLAEFIAAIAEFTEQAQHDLTLSQWTDLLLSLFDRFFVAGSGTAEETLRAAVCSLKEPETLRLFGGTVDLETVACCMGTKIGRINTPVPFMSGPVTFCAMMPMRSIPFRVICCIGMNGTSFPRTSYHTSWDLIAADPKHGDRSLDREDRYLFLEAILSAREMLYISYIGQSVRDNTRCQPSVVVEELLEYIDKGFFGKDNGFITMHPLQAWDRRYFEGDLNLFSFSTANAATADALAASRPDPCHGFCESSLPSPAPEFHDVTLEILTAFFRHPAKFFLNNRLSMTLDEQEEQLEETEAFLIGGLQRYTMAQELTACLLQQTDIKELYALLRGRGQLPHANAGKYAFDSLAQEVNSFVVPVKDFLSVDTSLPPITFEQHIGDFFLHGVIENLYGSGRMTFRCANAKPKDFLALWIRHLALNTFRPSGPQKTSERSMRSRRSLLFTKDGIWRLEPMENGLRELEKLLSWYEKGLRHPLHFFPESSYEYADCIVRKNKPHEYGLANAQQKWNSGEWSRAESDDPYYGFCFRTGLELGEEFALCAIDVWSPLFKHLTKSKNGSSI